MIHADAPLGNRIGALLQRSGVDVTAAKADPTLSSWVDDGDGLHGDSELWEFERALNVTLTSDHHVTMGKVRGPSMSLSPATTTAPWERCVAG
jgi:hypothetical protein